MLVLNQGVSGFVSFRSGNPSSGAEISLQFKKQQPPEESEKRLLVSQNKHGSVAKSTYYKQLLAWFPTYV